MTYEIFVHYRSANCELTVWEDEATISVSAVFAGHRKRGHATGALRRACAIADGMNYEMILRIQPYGDGERMDFNQLKEFYKKFGFKFVSSDTMTRSRKNQGL